MKTRAKLHCGQGTEQLETTMLGKTEGRRRDDRGWDGWMASPIQWTWVWVDSGSWWWTGRPGVLLSMGSQRVGHNWAPELNWTEGLNVSVLWRLAYGDLMPIVMVWGDQWKSLSRVQLFVTPWTIQSMEFSRPEYWSGEPFPSPVDLSNPGIEHRSPTLQVDTLPAEPRVWGEQCGG